MNEIKLEKRMCGSKSSGPSPAEQIAVENSAKARADAEIARINAEREAEKEAQNAKVVSEQAAVANQDAARRVRNRTLLAGLSKEETSLTDEIDPLAELDPLDSGDDAVKASRATHISLAL